MSRCSGSAACHHDPACEDVHCPGRPDNAPGVNGSHFDPLTWDTNPDDTTPGTDYGLTFECHGRQFMWTGTAPSMRQAEAAGRAELARELHDFDATAARLVGSFTPEDV